MLALHTIPDAFSIVECKHIVAALADVARQDALLVGQTQSHELRKAELVWIDDVAELDWVMDRLIDVVRRCNSATFDFDLREFAESPQVATYKATNNGHFGWHSDIGAGQAASKRKLTLVLQLSEASSYAGGDLEIMPTAQVVLASRAQGCVSIFPSFSLHHVTPIQTGTRHSLTVWAHGPAFRFLSLLSTIRNRRQARFQDGQ
ncbi:PKHD-type hydroxylase [Planktotalea frisia]|jgi:PKHD-type hydroxylase|uniref:PKHD-type hydroxylase n=1 Tax=Planktotalea frisia TaxID=696762 RepID=A0A1L9P291_9RHOB|nr:2OG-Fe(II) oxygenase [Planktotalea frisia]OJI95659.1 PKHD-type hydroxylase [Planktotalea frisia]PZX20855.1 PKHD-type hydroxylase [Planktotalea frisia]